MSWLEAEIIAIVEGPISLIYVVEIERPSVRELKRDFNDIVELYRFAMDELIEIYKDMLKVERVTMEELQKKVRLDEGCIAIEKTKVLVKAIEAICPAYDFGFDEYKALVWQLRSANIDLLVPWVLAEEL